MPDKFVEPIGVVRSPLRSAALEAIDGTPVLDIKPEI